jgi:hypothetical protein
MGTAGCQSLPDHVFPVIGQLAMKFLMPHLIRIISDIEFLDNLQ